MALSNWHPLGGLAEPVRPVLVGDGSGGSWVPLEKERLQAIARGCSARLGNGSSAWLWAGARRVWGVPGSSCCRVWGSSPWAQLIAFLIPPTDSQA